MRLYNVATFACLAASVYGYELRIWGLFVVGVFLLTPVNYAHGQASARRIRREALEHARNGRPRMPKPVPPAPPPPLAHWFG